MKNKIKELEQKNKELEIENKNLKVFINGKKLNQSNDGTGSKTLQVLRVNPSRRLGQKNPQYTTVY